MAYNNDIDFIPRNSQERTYLESKKSDNKVVSFLTNTFLVTTGACSVLKAAGIYKGATLLAPLVGIEYALDNALPYIFTYVAIDKLADIWKGNRERAMFLEKGVNNRKAVQTINFRKGMAALACFSVVGCAKISDNALRTAPNQEVTQTMEQAFVNGENGKMDLGDVIKAGFVDAVGDVQEFFDSATSIITNIYDSLSKDNTEAAVLINPSNTFFVLNQPDEYFLNNAEYTDTVSCSMHM